MSIMVKVDTDDAFVLSMVGRMFTDLARGEAGLEPLGCGCKAGTDPVVQERLDRMMNEVQPGGLGPIHPTHGTLGPITQHCLDLAKEQNAADAVDPAAAFTSLAPSVADLQPPAAAPTPFHSIDPSLIVPHLSGEYISPTGVLAPGMAPPPPAPVTLDKNQLPWDARINTSNKAQTQQGVWKRKPGLTDEEYNRVVGELRAAQGATVAPPASVVEPPVQPAPIAAPPVVPAPPVAPSAPAPAAPAPPAPPAAPAATAGPTTFPELLPHVTGAINAGKITTDVISQILSHMTNGAITSLPLLATRVDLIPEAYRRLSEAWGLA